MFTFAVATAALSLCGAAASHGAAGAAIEADRLDFRLDAGTRLTRKFESRQEISLDEVEMTMNGQPFPLPGKEAMTMVQAQRLQVADHFVAIQDGAPLKLVREFVAIGSEGEFTQQKPASGGEQTHTVRAESDLEGKQVVFERADREAEFTKRFEPEGPDEKLLVGLVEDADFRAFLPAAGEAAEDARWTVEVGEMRRVFLPCGDLVMKPVREAGEDESLNMFGDNPADAFGDLTGEVQATYKGRREVEGRSLGVIALEFKVQTRQDMRDKVAKAWEEAAQEGVDMQVDKMDVTLSLEGEAELLWDIDARHAAAFSMTAKVQNQVDMEMTVALGEKRMEMGRRMAMSGNYELETAIAQR